MSRKGELREKESKHEKQRRKYFIMRHKVRTGVRKRERWNRTKWYHDVRWCYVWHKTEWRKIPCFFLKSNWNDSSSSSPSSSSATFSAEATAKSWIPFRMKSRKEGEGMRGGKVQKVSSVAILDKGTERMIIINISSIMTMTGAKEKSLTESAWLHDVHSTAADNRFREKSGKREERGIFPPNGIFKTGMNVKKDDKIDDKRWSTSGKEDEDDQKVERRSFMMRMKKKTIMKMMTITGLVVMVRKKRERRAEKFWREKAEKCHIKLKIRKKREEIMRRCRRRRRIYASLWYAYKSRKKKFT